MRIWIVHQNAYTPRGAGSTRHFEFAKRLNTGGHEVTIIASSFDHKRRCETVEYGDGDQKRENVEGVDYLWIKSPAYTNSRAVRLWGMLGFYLACRRLARSTPDKPDVVIGSSPPLLGALGGLHIARSYGVPFVLEIRDIWPMTLREFGGLSRANPLYWTFAAMERRLYRNADRIISTLPKAEEHIGRPVDWLPNGSAFVSTSVPAKVDGSSFRIVYTGAHGPSNDLHTIIEAAAVLRHFPNPNVEFHFYGEGSEKERLIERAKELALDNVFFHRAFPKAGFPAIAAEADAFVAAVPRKNLYRYGISLNKLSDYCAAGRPIVLATDARDNPVSLSGCGYVVNAENATAVADAILRLSEADEDERQRMAQMGRAYAKQHLGFDELAARLELVLIEASSFEGYPASA